MKFRKLIASLGIAITLLMAASTGVMAASEGEEANGNTWVSPVNLKGERPISVCENNPNSRGREVRFDHESGFLYSSTGSSGEPLEKVWGKTYHNYYDDGMPADGYTRARYELGTKYKGDTGRQWDSKLHSKILGHSEATSTQWLDTAINFYTGHTYYGTIGD